VLNEVEGLYETLDESELLNEVERLVEMLGE